MRKQIPVIVFLWVLGLAAARPALSQVPARPELPSVRFKVVSVRPVDPSGRMFSSMVVKVCPSSEMVHLDVPVILPFSLLVDSQLFGPVGLIDQV